MARRNRRGAEVFCEHWSENLGNMELPNKQWRVSYFESWGHFNPFLPLKQSTCKAPSLKLSQRTTGYRKYKCWETWHKSRYWLHKKFFETETEHEQQEDNDKEGDVTARGGTPLYGLYSYVRPQRVCFSAVLVINRVSNLADSGHK